MHTRNESNVLAVVNKHDIPTESVVGIYHFGSSTYGTRTEKSDFDFVVIADMIPSYIQFESDDMDIHILSTYNYKKRLKEHDIMALEVYFNQYPILKYETEFVLDLPTLRRSISAVVSNSWVKAKKKVTLENEDSWVGYKSLFHSMRILDFGIQIAETGKIHDFHRVTHIWNEILEKVKNGEDFETLMAHYKPYHNQQSTLFRKLAPKE